MVSAEKVRHRGQGNNLVTGVSCLVTSCQPVTPSHHLVTNYMSRVNQNQAHISESSPGFVKHHQSLVNSDINIVQEVNHDGQEQSNQFAFIEKIFTVPYKIGLMKI